MDTFAMEEQQDSDSSNELELTQDVPFIKLTELVRERYRNYLKKLLIENLKASEQMKNAHNKASDKFVSNNAKYIDACTDMLEDRALKACMMAQIYQRTMIKVMAEVRHHTDFCNLQQHLQTLLEDQEKVATKKPTNNNKATQTEAQKPPAEIIEPRESLDERIKKMFFSKQNVKTCTSNWRMLHQKKQQHNQHKKHYVRKRRPLTQANDVPKEISPALQASPNDALIGAAVAATPDLHAVDEVDLALSELFSEDGDQHKSNNNYSSIEEQMFQMHYEPKNFLAEQANCAYTPASATSSLLRNNSISPNISVYSATTNKSQKISPIKQSAQTCNENLRNSLWPCELYMQRRRLANTLSRLVEEDLRWYPLMKEKFTLLFGEDSDNELDVASPSIELDDVLMGSCVRRITHWVVKHLMKPMNEGLIGNRYIFKKLAKKLARQIITEDQYPDERTIKCAIEDYFCLHQSVMFIED